MKIDRCHVGGSQFKEKNFSGPAVVEKVKLVWDLSTIRVKKSLLQRRAYVQSLVYGRYFQAIWKKQEQM